MPIESKKHCSFHRGMISDANSVTTVALRSHFAGPLLNLQTEQHYCKLVSVTLKRPQPAHYISYGGGKCRHLTLTLPW